jgi:ABC-2 type transport system permease protein
MRTAGSRTAATSPQTEWGTALGLALPLTYYLEVLRGILLKDVGMAYLWKETLILLGFAVVLVTLSVNRFSKTIE